jgi:DNA-directed RNA polymerase specialized sigma24 family protein
MDERGAPEDAETNPWEGSGDRQSIVELFETLRGKLTLFFEARRCVDAEGLADATLERVIEKLCEGTKVADLTGYSFGVAKNIIREDARKERARQRYVEEQRHRLQAVQGEEDDEAALRERRLKCLEDCTARLRERERWTLFEYYKLRGQRKLEHRRKMAEQLNISREALTLRIFHLKQRLKRCINDCLKNASTE